jgi:hypothetical protein
MKLLKITAVIVVLACAGLGAELCILYASSFPLLAAGLPSNIGDANREFDRRIKEQFSIGSSETALIAHLMHEGWGNPIVYREQNANRERRYVKIRKYASLVILKTAFISWATDEQGRLTEIQGAYGVTGL